MAEKANFVDPMRISYAILFIILLISCIHEKENTPNLLSSSNPFNTALNERIAYDDIRIFHVTEAFEYIKEKVTGDFQDIYNIPASDRTFENTMKAIDESSSEYYETFYAMSLLGAVHPDDEIKDSANNYLFELVDFSNQIFFSDEYYKTIQEYSMTEEAKSLNENRARLLNETLSFLQKSGLGLPNDQKEQIREITDKIDDLGNQFLQNIEDSGDEIKLTEDELTGMNEGFLRSLRKHGNEYYMAVNYSMYSAYLREAESESGREKVFRNFANRRVDENKELLEEMVALRRQLANLLGFENYTDFLLSSHPLKSSEEIWTFLDDLDQRVRPLAIKDYEQLLEVKKQVSTSEDPAIVEVWNRRYFENILLKTKYKVDVTQMSNYFEVFASIDGIIEILEELYSVEIREIQDVSKWHQDVKAYEIIENGSVIATFYIDLFARENKIAGSFTIPITFSQITAEGRVKPSSLMVTNFMAPTKSAPSILTHDELVDLFRLFGVVIQHSFGEIDLFTQNVFTSEEEFAFAPGDMFANWAFEYDVLKRFAKHYKTGELLPESDFLNLKESRTVGLGIETNNQILFSAIDLTLHNTYDPASNTEKIESIVADLENEISLFPHVAGTNLETSFSHLYDYGSNYYTYLLSEVYAKDLFSVFQQGGIFNPEVGARFRNSILKKGSSSNEYEMIREFLGRDPSQGAYIQSIGAAD